VSSNPSTTLVWRTIAIVEPGEAVVNLGDGVLGCGVVSGLNVRLDKLSMAASFSLSPSLLLLRLLEQTNILVRSLTSVQTAILIQARAGHCRLNQYLSRIGVVDKAKCSCRNDEETIRHLILSCPRWTDGSIELRETVGARSGDVSYLLGGWGSRKDVRTGQLLDGPKEKWKSDIEVVKATIRFLEKTGRLTYQPEAE